MAGLRDSRTGSGFLGPFLSQEADIEKLSEETELRNYQFVNGGDTAAAEVYSLC